MKKREFLKTSAVLSAGLFISPLFSACDDSRTTTDTSDDASNEPGKQLLVQLPELNYAYDALEPYIDAKTMEIHHSKHHAGYTKKFKAALEASSLENTSIETLFHNLGEDASDLSLRNNGGGYYNHALFWESIGPNKGGQPTGKIKQSIEQSFGSFDNFAANFKDAAAKRFGSGWAWLIQNDKGSLQVVDTPNQDNPLMQQLVETNGQPILGLDVWEHAYYLKYQNRRKEYINAFFNLIDWERINSRLL
jgi:Fe-Mn family superoxide dismutase